MLTRFRKLQHIFFSFAEWVDSSGAARHDFCGNVIALFDCHWRESAKLAIIDERRIQQQQQTNAWNAILPERVSSCRFPNDNRLGISIDGHVFRHAIFWLHASLFVIWRQSKQSPNSLQRTNRRQKTTEKQKNQRWEMHKSDWLCALSQWGRKRVAPFSSSSPPKRRSRTRLPSTTFPSSCLYIYFDYSMRPPKRDDGLIEWNIRCCCQFVLPQVYCDARHLYFMSSRVWCLFDNRPSVTGSLKVSMKHSCGVWGQKGVDKKKMTTRGEKGHREGQVVCAGDYTTI